ncbi:MAG: GNAT family N-acetyltransferase [Myxococcaceae bacterium]|jgi:GNAT superfamily N-acetyltransferase|nr:GNAT family N-acetyltransferase [Myxococcaceae bacterium]MCA3015549.1 GNAT family N-acetyltransferase [Myxococcaceae bacterium]
MRLDVATDFEKGARDRFTATAWGRHLTAEQFFAREATLRAHPFARAAMRTWLLREATGAVASSCETFLVPFRGGGHGALIASVFTEAPLRGRGHATAMLEAVCARLRAEAVRAVGLFSEVGARLYERVGFVAQPAQDLLLPAEPSPDTGVEWHAEGALPPSDEGTFTLTAAQCDWHVERERFYARALGRPAPAWRGASLGGSRCDWAASFQTNELHVLWYAFSSVPEAQALLRAARHVASSCGLDAVRVWETSALPTADGARTERNDELPMIRPLDGSAARWRCIHRGLWA